MFIPIGYRRVVLNEQIDETFCCPRCNSTYGARIEISRQHIQFFWIPTFAFPKRLRIYCLECQKKIKLKTLRDSQQIPILNLVSKSRGPLWQFTGSFILLGLSAIVLIFMNLGDSVSADEVSYEDPKVGDRLIYEVSEGKYSSYLVEGIESDTLKLRRNLISSDKKYHINDLLEGEKLDSTIIKLSLKDLKQLSEEGVFYASRP